MEDRETLTGGGVNEVVRIGATVRRLTGAWSPLVHGLLRHVRERGFTAAPAVHEVTDDGFEILDFLPGEVSNYPPTPAAASQTALESAAELLRAYHDATVGYAPGVTEGWMLPARSPAEVICHGDYAPHNCVLDGERVVGVIDFDTAHPGPRLWDIGYAVYRWAPTTAPGNADGFGTAEQQARRARTFCDRYGLDAAGRAGLVDAITARLHALVDFMRAQAAAGNEAFARHLADGHHLQYLADAAYVEQQRPVFERHLLMAGHPQPSAAHGAGLADPRPAVRARAALALPVGDEAAGDPAAGDEAAAEAVQVLLDVARTPRAVELSEQPGPDTPTAAELLALRRAVIAELCERVSDFGPLHGCATAALPLAFREAPCPDLGPYLRRAFPDGWPAPGTCDGYQRAFAGALADEAHRWQGQQEANRIATLRSLGLPADIDTWRALSKDYPELSTAADIVVLDTRLSLRWKPWMYVGHDRTDPAFPAGVVGTLVRRLVDEGLEVTVTVESDLRFTVYASGWGPAPMSPGRGAAEVLLAEEQFWYSTTTAVLARVAAFCSTTRVQSTTGGRGYAQGYAELLPLGPLHDLGPAAEPGAGDSVRITCTLDADWLPPGTALPDRLDLPARVVDLRS